MCFALQAGSCNELILMCLDPNPDQRPTWDTILAHPFLVHHAAMDAQAHFARQAREAAAEAEVLRAQIAAHARQPGA